MTLVDIEQSLGIPQNRSKPALETLISEGKAKLSIHGGEAFYEAVQ
jgi:hypothetical protein